MRAAPIITLFVLAAACSSETPGPTADDLRVQDSLLNHDVMAAWGDSFRVTVEEPVYKDSAPVKAVAPKSVVAIAPAPVTQPRPTTFSLTPVLPKPQPAKVATTKAVASREMESVRAPRAIPKGASLSLVTNERICTSHIGETFRATLVAPISTSSGTIPSGARAIAEITSSDQWGAGIGVRIRSIHSDGNTWPVTSRVTYVVPESGDDGTCIPRRARIDTEVRG